MGFHNGFGNISSELDFLQGFPFTSTELVTIRNGFPQWSWKQQTWISIHKYWIGNNQKWVSTMDLETSELDFLKRISIHKYWIGNNQKWVSTMDLETSELDFLKRISIHKYWIGNIQTGFPQGLPFTSTELVVSEMAYQNGFGNTRPGFPQRISIHKYRIGDIRNGFPQWIWKHQNWISSEDVHSQIQNW